MGQHLDHRFFHRCPKQGMHLCQGWEGDTLCRWSAAAPQQPIFLLTANGLSHVLYFSFCEEKTLQIMSVLVTCKCINLTFSQKTHHILGFAKNALFQDFLADTWDQPHSNCPCWPVASHIRGVASCILYTFLKATLRWPGWPLFSLSTRFADLHTF